TAFSGATLRLKFSSMKDRKYNVVFVTQLVMGNEELAHDYICEIEDNRARLRLADSTFAYSHYPDLNYKIEVSATKFEFLDEKWLFGSDGYEEGLFLIRVTDASGSLTISGSIENDAQSTIEDYDTEKQRFKKKYQELLNGFELSLKSASASVRSELEKLNLIAYWYAHDALIHYASPHGLEQFGGAAWGTRDVLQGPFEFFMATHKFFQAKDVLLNVFRHQFLETGNWPQWFMFDRYSKIQTHEAHGDIIVWPMRALANYLLATGDYDLLDNKVCYTQNTNFEYTMSQHSIYEHLRLEIKHILDNLIPGTHLSVYGDGDWDDTLQPANAELRQSMTSGWTTALTFEAFFLLGEALREYDPDYSRFSLDKASKIKEDYEKYVIQDGIPAGFLDFSAGYPRPMIHPNDNVTKIKYRLLPLQRGIISELFEPSQAALAFKTIMDNLDHPDGVRLMNTTVPYQGGKNTYFKRAETAANFGREIGLQYVHAHIRFLEACWRIGEKERAWRGLFQINPINIQEAVANADYRQANTYFSSSDANFMNRYQAMAEFAKIHEGKIKVKGGWRIYSSGPGIYLNILLGRILGISASAGSLLIDPQLPEMLDGLELKYNLFGKKARLIYRIASQSAKKKQIRVNGKLIDCELTANKYRLGGCHIPLSDLNLHQETENLIEILCF
ncbi:MAG: cellobiose phosphorylase, partial [Bacilli bacterium]|nr:cellobiose phosphorylase [Bacilli bacterium]